VVDMKIYVVRAVGAYYPTFMGELSCIAQVYLACMSLSLVFLSGPRPTPFWTYPSTDPCELAPTRAFYSSRSSSYNESRGPIGGPEAVQTLCCRVQWLGVANDTLHNVSSVERHVLSLCCTEHVPYHGAVLLDHITSVAMSRSGQLGRRCTVETHYDGIHVFRRFSNARACLGNTRA
jgi:hypothetical protein